MLLLPNHIKIALSTSWAPSLLFLVLSALILQVPTLSRANDQNQEATAAAAAADEQTVAFAANQRKQVASAAHQQQQPGELESAVLVDESQVSNDDESIQLSHSLSSSPNPQTTTTSTTSAPTTQVSSRTVAPTATTQQQQLNYAELCYLSNGGSSLTLTVNEATQVGAVIGTVEVNGDPALEGGNVDLSIVPDARWAQNGTTTTHELASHDPKRRILRRRRRHSMGADSFPESDTPTRRALVGSPPPPLSSGQMMGLVSDYQSSGSGHSASYYSLLTSTAGPAHSASSPTGPLGPALRLEPGSRDLILMRPLDKESSEGEVGLVVSVRCQPRKLRRPQQTSDNLNGARSVAALSSADSTTIPVRITVTDANDHAPEFVIGPRHAYVVNVSETAAVGTVVSRDLLAIDRDSAGPFSTLHYRVLDDGHAHSALLQFASPLDPTLLVASPLDYETLSSFTLTIVAQDQGEPEPLSSSAQVQVNVIDFDDQNPKFLDDKYTLIMDESQQNLVGQNLQVLPRNLYAEDGDRAINAPIVYTFDQLGGGDTPSSVADSTTASGTGTAASNSLADNEPNPYLIDNYLHLNPNSGELRLLRQWPNKWMGSPMTLVIRATQADNKDRYALTTLTITRASSISARSGANGQSTLSINHQSAMNKSTSNHNRAASINQDHESLATAGTESSAQSARDRHGIQFANERLTVEVLESVPINEKIARVRAKYLSNGDSLSTIDSQLVDLVQDWQQKVVQNNNNNNNNKTRQRNAANRQQVSSSTATTAAEQHVANKRPINYQILDDQTDQFGINGLGEIFVKRALDYEQRQEYKFRVLATYTKYSDICQVQVNVLNVNDNRPKFTQPQYTFHLTESRLRSNVIGVVQAYDSDLNDTIRYTLSGEQAHLFEINQATGQLSLKTSIKQLNMNACQLTVQATDSLATPFHQHQARINLHIAPQLVGRSINLEHLMAASDEQQQQQSGAKSFNSRSLGADRARSLATSPGGTGKADLSSGISNQRSSVATVMSSLQHMVRSVNFLEMPMSSALLLSALLAFLVCLLFIVIISMSVHLYRRRSKSRHRQSLAATAHLRHAHMAAALQSPTPGGPSQRYLRTSGGGGSGGGSGGNSSSNSSPTNSTAAGGSPGNFSNQQLRLNSPQQQMNSSGQLNARLLVKAVPPTQQRSRPISAPKMGSPRERAAGAQLQRGVSAVMPELSLISSLSSHSKRSYRSNTTDDSSVMHCGHYSVNSSRSPCQSKQQQHEQQQQRQHSTESAETLPNKLNDCLNRSAVEAAIESLVRQDDSSGHLNEVLTVPVIMNRDNIVVVDNVDDDDEDQMGDDEATIRRETTNNTKVAQAAINQQAKQVKLHRSAAFSETRHSQQPNEMADLTYSKPNIKAYRKLPLMGSLVRNNRVGVAGGEEPAVNGVSSASSSSSSGSEPQVSGAEVAQDSAIASDASSSGNSGNQKQQQQQQQQKEQPIPEVTAGLMAMIRDAEARRVDVNSLKASFISPEQQSQQQQQQQRNISDHHHHHFNKHRNVPEVLSDNCNATSQHIQSTMAGNIIKWPQDALPQRVKKLTWDDELSISNDECFVAPGVRRSSAARASMSPLSNHLYLIEGTTTDNEDHYAEQHFLFSNTCSPALASVDYTTTATTTTTTNSATQPLVVQQLDEPASSFMGQNNCFDYTIVQSSQFQVDQSQFNVGEYGIINQDINNNNNNNHHHQQSLSAQHHLLQLQLQLQQQQSQHNQLPPTKRPNNSYLYSNSFINNQPTSSSTPAPAASGTNQDLKLMTTAVL